jgi:hypothetical protein
MFLRLLEFTFLMGGIVGAYLLLKWVWARTEYDDIDEKLQEAKEIEKIAQKTKKVDSAAVQQSKERIEEIRNI